MLRVVLHSQELVTDAVEVMVSVTGGQVSSAAIGAASAVTREAELPPMGTQVLG